MNITDVTRLKHGSLYEALERIRMSQTELSIEIGVPFYVINKIVNLTKKPSFELSEKIRLVMSCYGENIDVLSDWPEGFDGFESPVVVSRTVDISDSNLFALSKKLYPPSYHDIQIEESRKILEDVMETLTKNERIVLSSVELDGLTQADVARKLNLSSARISVIHKMALMKMRSPKRIAKLRTALL